MTLLIRDKWYCQTYRLNGQGDHWVWLCNENPRETFGPFTSRAKAIDFGTARGEVILGRRTAA